MKKLLSIFLCLCMVLGLCAMSTPVEALAGEMNEGLPNLETEIEDFNTKVDFLQAVSECNYIVIHSSTDNQGNPVITFILDDEKPTAGLSDEKYYLYREGTFNQYVFTDTNTDGIYEYVESAEPFKGSGTFTLNSSSPFDNVELITHSNFDYRDGIAELEDCPHSNFSYTYTGWTPSPGNAQGNYSMTIDVTMHTTEISVTVPLNVTCTINPNVEDGFTYGDISVQNNALAPVKISVGGFAQKDGAFTLLAPDEIESATGLSWDALNGEQSAEYLSIGINAADTGWQERLANEYVYADNVSELSPLGIVAGKVTAPLELEAHYGRSFKEKRELSLQVLFVAELCSDGGNAPGNTTPGVTPEVTPSVTPQVTPDVSDPSEDEEILPTGTWQLKNTTDKKYLILGTDDDNVGNAKFFRLLRTYDFPYTMNVEAENIAKALGSDVDDTMFTEDDAPALFPDGVDVVTLGKYLYDNDLGEVAQHGSSSKKIWDSTYLTGDFLTELHTSYTDQGGTRTEEELRNEIMIQLADTDVAQGAPYIADSREILEEAYGFPIKTVGNWGGTPTATVDGVEFDLRQIGNINNYDWRGMGYTAVGGRVGVSVTGTITASSEYDLLRYGGNFSKIQGWIDQVEPGRSVEIYWHMPFNDEPDIAKWRELFDYLKDLEDTGKIEVVTRAQYAELGEYVFNPVTKITVSRNGNILLGESDSNDAYTVIATYADGSTADVSDEAVINQSGIDLTTVGKYTVSATYRGFSANTFVSVIDGSYTIPEGLKDQGYWFLGKNETQNILFAGNSTRIVEAGNSANALCFKECSCTNGVVNGWLSYDNGTTWTKVNDNMPALRNIKTNTTEGTTAFNFGFVAKDSITWFETSGNFTITYAY